MPETNPAFFIVSHRNEMTIFEIWKQYQKQNVKK